MLESLVQPLVLQLVPSSVQPAERGAKLERQRFVLRAGNTTLASVLLLAVHSLLHFSPIQASCSRLKQEETLIRRYYCLSARAYLRTSVRILERSQNNGFATLKNELEVRLNILSIYENRSLLAAPLDLRLTHLDRSVTITCLFICEIYYIFFFAKFSKITKI